MIPGRLARPVSQGRRLGTHPSFESVTQSPVKDLTGPPDRALQMHVPGGLHPLTGAGAQQPRQGPPRQPSAHTRESNGAARRHRRRPPGARSAPSFAYPTLRPNTLTPSTQVAKDQINKPPNQPRDADRLEHGSTVKPWSLSPSPPASPGWDETSSVPTGY